MRRGRPKLDGIAETLERISSLLTGLPSRKGIMGSPDHTVFLQEAIIRALGGYSTLLAQLG